MPLFVTLLASFQALLSRYADQDDMLVGTSLRSRDRVEAEPLIGPLASTVMLRTDFSGDPSFCELLARVCEGTREAMAHKYLPFERLVVELELDRDPGQPPLPQVMFTLQESAVPALEAGDLVVSPPKLDTAPQTFDLALSVVEAVQELTGTLTYNADLFESATIARMAGHFRTLLEGVVAHPEERLSALPVLTQAERHQLLVEWNDARADYPRDSCVHRLFEQQVERTPDTVALASAARQLPYRELNRRSNQLAHRLQALGVGPEVLVGICIERSLDMVVALLAILKAGGAYVPLDPSYPMERLAFMLADAQVPVLLSRQRLVAGLGSVSARVICMDGDAAAEAGEPEENPDSGVTAQNLAYVMYTSGSTGQPKGVMIPHRGLINYLWWATKAYAVADGSGAPVHTPLGFDLTITSLFPPLLRGRTVVLVREGQGIEALSSTLRASSNFSPVKITPAHLSLLSQSLPAGEAAGRARTLVIGGEALCWEHLAFWQRHAPATRLINEYGPTETVVGCCVYEASAGSGRSGPVPIGRPIANTQLYVLDRHRQPVPIGVPGELYISGDGVGRGYLNRPELTAASFIPDPFSAVPGARLYKTGDLARYLPDSNLEFLGRVDHQVKLRGFRIEPGEIEAALGQHPAVQAVAVVVRERAPGDTALVAYLKARSSPGPSPAQLRQHLVERLPAFMIPSAFVQLPTLPLSPTGKVDRHALPAPGRVHYPAGESDSAGPRDAMETRLVEIWEEILRIRPIGVAEDFFDLGGHSLLVTQLIMRIEQAFGIRIPVTGLFMAPTIAQLATVLRGGGPPAGWPRVTAIQPAGSRPPFFCVDAAAFFRPLAHRLGLDQPFLGLPLDATALPTPFALEDVAAFYVRTIREVQPSGPYQVGGWSANGVVAYEVAQQLRAQGEDVALLALFDSWNPARAATPGRAVPRARVLRVAELLAFHWRNLRYGGLTKVPGYVRVRLETIRQKLRERSWRARYTLRRRIGQPIDGQLRDADQVTLFTVRTYRPRPYAGRVVLFRSSERPPGTARDPAVGWRDLVDHLEVRDIPGDHRTIFMDPNLDVLVAALRACLDGKRLSDSGDVRAVTLVP